MCTTHRLTLFALPARLALKRDGTVVAWGADRNGQTSVPEGQAGGGQA